MRRVLRFVTVAATLVVAVALLGLAEVFGSCEGWKGTGSCPREPLWSQEVFNLAFVAGVLPTLALRWRRGAGLRLVAEAATAGVLTGTATVILTGI